MYWRHDPHYSHNPYFELKWIVLALSPVILSRHLFFFALCLCVVSSSLLWQIRSAVTCCLRLCCHRSDLPNFPARMLLSNPSHLCLVTAACSSQMFLREIFVSPQPLMWFVWLNNKAEWFNSLSVWSSRFCLHNQDSTMRIFSLVQSWLYFRFLLALPTFHWPHHTFFLIYFFNSNVIYLHYHSFCLSSLWKAAP